MSLPNKSVFFTSAISKLCPILSLFKQPKVHQRFQYSVVGQIGNVFSTSFILNLRQHFGQERVPVRANSLHGDAQTDGGMADRCLWRTADQRRHLWDDGNTVHHSMLHDGVGRTRVDRRLRVLR